MSWIITYPPEYYLKLGGSGAPTETRYIATLKASEGGYIKLPQPIEIAAGDDFEITYVFATDAPAYSVLIGNGTTRLFRIEPNGELRAYCGVMNLTSTIIVNDGKLHTATVKRIGNVFSLKVDNENELSVANALVFSELIFEEITKHGTSYSNVTPLELKSTTLNTLTHHYDFNVAKGTTIIPNLAHPLGSELVLNGFHSQNSVVNDTGSGFLVTENTMTQTRAYTDINLEIGKSYLMTQNLKASSIPSVAVYIREGTGGSGTIVESVSANVKAFYFTATAEAMTILWAMNSQGSFEVDNVSIKEAPHWAEYINVTDDNKELHEWDAGRNAWVGEELWNTSTGYVVNTGASTSTYDGQVGHLQTLGDYTGLRQIDVQTIGATYLFSCEVFDVIDSGSGYLTLGENYGDGRNTPITPKLDAIFKADTTYAQVKRAQGSYDLKLRNISFRHILEVAQ